MTIKQVKVKIVYKTYIKYFTYVSAFKAFNFSSCSRLFFSVIFFKGT